MSNAPVPGPPAASNAGAAPAAPTPARGDTRPGQDRSDTNGGTASALRGATITGADPDQAGGAGSDRQAAGQNSGGTAAGGEAATAPAPRPTTAETGAGVKGANAPAPVVGPTQARSDTAAADRSSAKARSSTAPAPAEHATAAAATAPDAAGSLPTPAQQVATALQSFIETAGRPTGTTTAGLEAARRTMATPAVTTTTASGLKSMTIDLDPGHLGPVSITMRLQGAALSIQIAVDNPETLRLLDRDRHLLTAAMVATGGSSDALAIGTTAASGGDSAATGGFGQSSFGDAPGRQPAFSSDASSTGRQAQGHGRPDHRADTETDHDDPIPTTIPVPRGRDGSLYL